MEAPDKAQITQWLSQLTAAPAGAHGAVDQLMNALYPELRQLAHRLFRDERADHTLQPTALVHEAYLRLVDQSQIGGQERSHFLAIAAKVMRRVLIDHARGRARQRRGGDRKITGIDSEVVPTAFTQAELLEINDALEKLTALDARQAQVVEMRFFGGMTVEEVAEALGVSKRTIEDDWTHAKAWLRLVLADGTDA
jgi:RNA polymerase sigma factor (TIGR02999 family)